MKPKVGRDFASERGGGEGVKGEVKNISLHWLQGIFETVPNFGPKVKKPISWPQKGGPDLLDTPLDSPMLLYRSIKAERFIQVCNRTKLSALLSHTVRYHRIRAILGTIYRGIVIHLQ